MANHDAAVASARKLITQLQAGDYQQATSTFDATMREAMPAAALQGGWEQVQAQAGAFQEALDATCESQDGYEVVLLKLRFANASVAARLVFDQAGQLAGMGFQPA